MAVYTHAMRQARPDKQKASLPGLVLQAIWRAGLLVARITALVLFTICCQAWIFLLLGKYLMLLSTLPCYPYISPIFFKNLHFKNA